MRNIAIDTVSYHHLAIQLSLRVGRGRRREAGGGKEGRELKEEGGEKR